MADKLTSRKGITSILPDNCIGAEIGVQRGFFSYDLCESGKFSKFYSIDSWEDQWEDVRFFSNGFSNTKIPIEEFNDWVEDFGGWEDNDEVYHIACDRLSKFDFNEVIRLKSVEAAKLFEDETFDFVYIDSSHNYDTVTNDLKTWLPKVKKGGILAGDDYIDKCDYYNFNQGRQVRCLIEVKSAVDNFFDRINILEIEEGDSQWYVIK